MHMFVKYGQGDIKSELHEELVEHAMKEVVAPGVSVFLVPLREALA